MKPGVHGDEAEVLRAIQNDTRSLVYFYGGGCQCGITMLAWRIMCNRINFGGQTPRVVVGSSIGAVVAMFDVYGLSREAVKLWVRDFCGEHFIEVSLARTRENRILSMQSLKDALLTALKDRAELTSIHQLHVVLTDMETGEQFLHQCDLTDVEGTIEAVTASCLMPTLTRHKGSVNGRWVGDGDIRDSVPYDLLMTLRPSHLLVILPTNWTWFSTWIWGMVQSLYLWHFCQDRIARKQLWQLFLRPFRFHRTMRRFRREWKLPLGATNRELIPVMVVSTAFQNNPTEAQPIKMWRAIRRSLRLVGGVVKV